MDDLVTYIDGKQREMLSFLERIGQHRFSAPWTRLKSTGSARSWPIGWLLSASPSSACLRPNTATT